MVIGRDTNKEEPYPYLHLGYRRFRKEESRVFDSQTHELQVAKSTFSKARVVVVWRGRLTPGACGVGGVFMKDLRIGFIEGFSREPKESLQLVAKLERSCTDLGPRERGSASPEGRINNQPRKIKEVDGLQELPSLIIYKQKSRALRSIGLLMLKHRP